ncbi:MAG: SMC family ATPase, partial [candidate division KSB1 bacterium]|nr:SMC family ATPase [candidate division KSB1 bacterium]
MILHSLRLRNFRRFRHAEIEFPENVIGLLGRNGAGKSTLLEAIAWALYGSRAARTDKQQIRSQFANERESCEVELMFRLGGETYRVWRSLAGKNAVVEAALYRGDSPLPEAERDSGVNEMVEKLLGLDYRAFEVSIFARQRELAALSDLQDEQRRKIISRLINLDAVDRARQQVSNDANEKRRFLEGAQTMQVDIPGLEQQLLQQQARLNAIREVLQRREESAVQLAAELALARKRMEEESARRDKHNQLLTEIMALRSQQKELARQRELTRHDQDEIKAEQPRLATLRPIREQYETLRHERERLQTQQQQLIRLQEKQQFAKNLLEQITARQTEAVEWQRQLGDLEKLAAREPAVESRLQQAQAEVLKWRAEERRLSNELASIETRGKDFKAKLLKVQELGAQSPCPICTRPLAEHYPSVVKHFEEELTTLRSGYVKLSEEKKRAEEALRRAEAGEEASRRERENLSAERARLHQIQDRLLQYQKQSGELQQRLQEVQSEIQAIGPVVFDQTRLAQVNIELRQAEAQLQELTQLETRAGRLPEINRRLAEIAKQDAEAKQREHELQAQLQNLRFEEQAYLNTRRDHDEANAKYLRSEQELGEAKAQAAAAEAEVRNLEQALNKARELQASIAQARHELVLLDSLHEHFKTFRTELAGRLRPLIADRASELLRMITAGRYSLLELDESYNIFIYDRNARYNLARFSGGEQDIANLCLRVAISQVVAQRTGKPPLQIIALDEIFGSQDEERKISVLATLQQLSNYFRQVFLITHVESIKENLPVVLQVEMA